MGLDLRRDRLAPVPSLKSTMLAPVRSVARPSVRSFSAASPWGTDGWRHDKNAFKAWCTAAVAPGSSKEKREFFGFLALSFGDVDTNKDGFINLEETRAKMFAEMSAGTGYVT